MKYLDLSRNEFGEVAGEILGPAIGKASCMLDLSSVMNLLVV